MSGRGIWPGCGGRRGARVVLCISAREGEARHRRVRGPISDNRVRRAVRNDGWGASRRRPGDEWVGVGCVQCFLVRCCENSDLKLTVKVSTAVYTSHFSGLYRLACLLVRFSRPSLAWTRQPRKVYRRRGEMDWCCWAEDSVARLLIDGVSIHLGNSFNMFRACGEAQPVLIAS
jgi:hypothetical protein